MATKLYKTAFSWYDQRIGKDWVITLSYTDDKMLTPRIEAVEASVRYMAEHHIQPFPSALIDLVWKYMAAHPEVDWYDDEYSDSELIT